MTAVPSIPLDQAMEHCRQVTRLRARNFYYGLKLSPEPQRSALYAIYAWMRQADDIVDEGDASEETLRQRVDAFRHKTDEVLAGRMVDDDPVWVCLAEVTARYGIEAQHLHDMIRGQLDDLNIHRYETFDQLSQYCYRVASTVGLVCIRIWGFNDPAAEALAIDRGYAFQLTNIIRDFREDYDKGRVYLPAEDFEKHALDPRALRYWDRPEAGKAMLLEQIDRALSYYRKSEALEEYISPPCVPALWAMTKIYRGTLEKIQGDPARILDIERVSLNPFQKSVIAIQAKWRGIRTRNVTT